MSYKAIREAIEEIMNEQFPELNLINYDKRKPCYKDVSEGDDEG